MFDPVSIPAQLRAVEDRRGDVIAARIEDASLAVAQPRQQSFYDGWLLRYSPGKAKRARSINAIGAGMLPLEDKIAHCIEFYVQRHLPCLYRITPFSAPRGLDRELEAAGFGAFQDTRVMKLDLSTTALMHAPSTARWVDVEQFTKAFSTLHRLDQAKADAEHERYTRSAVSTAYIAQFDGEAPIGCGSVAMDGKVAGIFGMVTADSHRGQGVATGLLVGLLRRAQASGAQTAYLQVEESNLPARRAYTKFGFEDCYAYWYRARLDDPRLDAEAKPATREGQRP